MSSFLYRWQRRAWAELGNRDHARVRCGASSVSEYLACGTYTFRDPCPCQRISRRNTSQDTREPREDGRPALGLGALGLADIARTVLNGLALFFLSAGFCRGALLLRCCSEEVG